MKARQFIEDLELKGRRVLIRVDFNVPLDQEQNITDNVDTDFWGNKKKKKTIKKKKIIWN